LNKTNASKEVAATPQILGMVRAVEHMVTVEEVKGKKAAAAEKE
jgi:large subunit ribosomal protein L30